MPHKSIEAKRDYQRRYFQENKERLAEGMRAASRRYHAKNAPEFAARSKAWREANPDRKKEYARQHRLRNLDRYLEREREARQRAIAKDPEGVRAKRRSKHLAKKYGITLEQYNAMHEAQGGTCKICLRPPSAMGFKRRKGFAVDHCHTTGAVRGLLCFRCNRALGQLEDSPELLRACAAYIESYRTGGQP
jgi:hypothetical protein